MSAYVVDRNHIRFLIEAAKYVAHRERSGSFRWWFDGGATWQELGPRDDESIVGQMLWDENIASVKARYGDGDDLPGPVGEDFKYAHHASTAHITPAQILKAADCYSYQSCEHPEWEASSAHAFIQSLKGSACRLVDGYEEAKWGAPDMGPAVVLLSKLVRREA